MAWPFVLIIIIPIVVTMATFDNRHAFAVTVVTAVPITVPAVIMFAVFNWATPVFPVFASFPVSVITRANAKSEALGASHRGGGYSQRRYNNKSRVPHWFLHSHVASNNRRE
jgi:hypothetical protein